MTRKKRILSCLIFASMLLSIGVAQPAALQEMTIEEVDAGIGITRISDSQPGKISYSTTYVDPEWEAPTNNNTRGTAKWRHGLVTGNGENGLIESGNPIENVMIFQNMRFGLPHDFLVREAPNLSPVLDTVRQQIIAGGNLTNAGALSANNTLIAQATAWLRNPDVLGGNASWALQHTQSFHPSHQLRMKMDESLYGIASDQQDYERYTNYETAEIGTNWTDVNGEKWQRKSFSSREDNVTITSLKAEGDTKINLTLSIDDISKMANENNIGNILDLRYKKIVDSQNASYIGEVVHYPSYVQSELKNGGFAGITGIIVKGVYAEKTYVFGSDTAIDNRTSEQINQNVPNETSINVGDDKDPSIKITNADEVILISKSARDVNMGAYADFANTETFDVVETLLRDISEVKSRYGNENFDYNQSLLPHATAHGEIFNRTSLDLNATPETRAMSNEELIAAQKNSPNQLLPAMLERMFYNGRYANICASGVQVPRLGGMWTGAWCVEWSGDYTTNANINLQVAGNNIGSMPESTEGFISLMLGVATDWQVNAKAIYGLDDSIMAASRTDGDRSMLTHFNASFPGEVWNSGASWLILPMYEYWLCYGNRQIPLTENIKTQLEDTSDRFRYKAVSAPGDETIYNLRTTLNLDQDDVNRIIGSGYLDLERDILHPLLTKQANFWVQFTDPRYYVSTNGDAVYDENHTALADGEKYLILPSYSPENTPSGFNQAITANATMDIMAARDGLNMAITIEKLLNNGQETEKTQVWEQLLADLPDYLYEPSGELKEWALKKYGENYDHRHISQLYGLWPAYEGKSDSRLFEGARKLVDTKKKSFRADSKSGHGWVHMGLVSARLKQGEAVKDSLIPLLTVNMIYNSMMTAHNNDMGAAYCTDASITIPAVLLESFVYSDDQQLELLPALMENLEESGQVTGIQTRSGGTVNSLTWNNTTVSSEIKIGRPTKLKLGKVFSKLIVDGNDVSPQVQVDDNGDAFYLLEDEGGTVAVQFTISDVQGGTYALYDEANSEFIAVNSMTNNSPIAEEECPAVETTSAGWNEIAVDSTNYIGFQNAAYITRYIDLNTQTGVENAAVATWNQAPTSTNRQFKLEQDGTDYYIWTTMKEQGATTWTASEDKVFADLNGSVVYQTKAEPADANQLWTRTVESNGVVTFKNKGTGNYMYLPTDGNNVAIRTINEHGFVSDMGFWRIDGYGAYYKIISTYTGKALTKSGDELIQSNFEGLDSQLWQITETGKLICADENTEFGPFSLILTADKEVRIVPDSITITPSKTELRNGGTVQFTASTIPERGADIGFTWQVIPETGSATINSSGLLTATGVGTVSVTASSTSGSATSDPVVITITSGVEDYHEQNGTIFGRTSGQWEQANPPSNAFDGNISTYYDGQNGGYCGLGFAEPRKIVAFRFASRQDQASRLDNTVFQVSNDGQSYTTVYKVAPGTAPGNGIYKVVYADDMIDPTAMESTEYKYFRFHTGDGSYSNIAEITVYSDEESVDPEPEPTPTPDPQAEKELIGSVIWADNSVDINNKQSSQGNVSVANFGDMQNYNADTIGWFFSAGTTSIGNRSRINGLDNTGGSWDGYIDITASVPKTDTYTLYVLCYNTPDTRYEVSVNGTSRGNTPGTSTSALFSSLNPLKVLDKTVELTEGSNTIKLQAPSGEQAPNFVALAVVGYKAIEYPDEIKSFSKTGTLITEAVVSAKEPGVTKLFTAAYNEDGRLAGIRCIDIDKEGINSYTIDHDYGADVNKVRALLWGGTTLLPMDSKLIYYKDDSLREEINVNRDWKFYYGDDVEGAQLATFDDSDWTPIAVPHSFSIPYDLHGPNFPIGYGWYRKDLEVREEWLNKRINLEFEGVFQVTELYVNGEYVTKSNVYGYDTDYELDGTLAATHEGGYTGFSVDITDFVKTGNNKIAIRVNNIWQPDLAPRGGDHQFSGGIYRNVKLTVTNPVHIDWYGNFVWTPALCNPSFQESENRPIIDPDASTEWEKRGYTSEWEMNGTGTNNILGEYVSEEDLLDNISNNRSDVQLETEITNSSAANATIQVVHQVIDSDGREVIKFQSEPEEFEGNQRRVITVRSNVIENIKLWSFDDPNLYTVKTTVYADDQAVDTNSSRFGFRSSQFKIDGFYLNGKKVWLDGVNSHQDQLGWGDAVTEKALYRDVQYVKEAGMNFIRGSHYPHAPIYAAACDELGIGFWSEGGLWSIGGSNDGDTVNRTTEDWIRTAYPLTEKYRAEYEKSCFEQVEAMIRINRNSPSVLMWSMGNEAFFSNTEVTQQVKELISDMRDRSHELDPTRKAGLGGTQRWDLNTLAVSDVAGGNGDGGTPRFTNFYIPHLVAEYHILEQDTSIVKGDRPGSPDIVFNQDSRVDNSEDGMRTYRVLEERLNLLYEDGTTETDVLSRSSGIALWCMFNHGSVGGLGLRKTGIVDYGRLPTNRYYGMREIRTKIPVPEGSIPGTATSIKVEMSTDSMLLPNSNKNQNVITNDGTDDVQIILTMLDADGRWVNDTREVVVEVIDGPGVFPGGKAYVFKPNETIFDGKCSITFRSYYSGTAKIKAYIPNSDVYTEFTVVITNPSGIDEGTEPEGFMSQSQFKSSIIPEPESYGSYKDAAYNRQTGNTSSYYEGHLPLDAVDNNPDTFWQAANTGSGEYWQIHLENQYYVYKVKLDFGDAEYPFTLSYVPIGGTADDWHVLVDYDEETVNTRPVEETFDGISTSQFRVDFKGVPADKYAKMHTFNVYGTTNKYLSDSVYVSDLEPELANVAWGTVTKDRTISQSGGSTTMLGLNGIKYEKGLGLHADSQYEYILDGGYSRFTSMIGIDDSAGDYSTSASGKNGVTFHVIGVIDDVEKELFASTNITSQALPQVVDISVSGVTRLKLITKGTNGGNSSAHTTWADARLTAALREISLNERTYNVEVATTSQNLVAGQDFKAFVRVNNNGVTTILNATASLILYDASGTQVAISDSPITAYGQGGTDLATLTISVPSGAVGYRAEIFIKDSSGNLITEICPIAQ